MAKQTSEEANLDRFRPKKSENAKRTNYFPKDELFNKKKTFITKGKQEVVSADWIRVAMGSKTIELVKGQAVLESELSLFDTEAKAYYLVEVKEAKTRKPKEAKEEGEAES